MTTPNQPADAFASSEGLPSISFATKDQWGNMTSKPIGTRIGGTVLKAPTMVQSRDFKTKQPKVWPDGNPQMSIVVDMDVDCGGEGDMALWVKKPSQLFKQIQDAKDKAGIPVSKGAKLYVTLVGFGKPEDDKAPAKLYSVEYTPADAFSVAPPSPISAPAGAVAPPPPGAPVSSPAEPVLSNGYTASALRAGGWSEAQIAALGAPVPVATPPAPPAPPVAPEATQDAAAAAAARIAALSPEDRALLGKS